MSGISFRDLAPHDRYKLLCGVVVPRPIALVTTLDENGTVNAAPFSFFNVFSEDPPLVVLGLQHKPDHSPKDTTRNIRRNGEFVVHMVDEALSSAMNACAVDFPSGDSEVAATGLATLASVDVRVPRLAAAPFALECRREVVLTFSPDRELLVGEVLRLHARDGLVDEANMYIDLETYRPIGRLFGNLYATQRDTFAMARESHAQWLARNDVAMEDRMREA
ncbi:nitrilotriacetate monooxygenase [Bradyrhizobium lablabi]|uniref:Nitrilotriacetate monooxygenase n=1 Tax=Bradyrhizobium lablabi TaxID=722472 RepID=A0A0R3MNC0_9BRAD|nr:flavin reductase family protein [Bradyrhizobium lablabi]KRR21515.1 nitrilotriacetate monooxygenase [Bradyrhizobium lablabi]